jgi:hypothetical protein
MRLLASIVALAWALPVHAAHITKINNLDEAVDIVIYGELTEGDAQAFRALIDSSLRDGTRIHRVRLNSPGGLVDEALAIGDIVRTLKLDTVAPTKMVWEGMCESACFYIWAAGIDRYGDDIGIHRPYFDPKLFARLSPGNAATEYKKLADLVAGKLEGWGVPELLVRRMLSASSQQMISLSPEDFQLLRNDPAFSELLISRCGADRSPSTDNSSDPFYDDCQIAALNERLDEGIRQYQGGSEIKLQHWQSSETVPIPTPAPNYQPPLPTLGPIPDLSPGPQHPDSAFLSLPEPRSGRVRHPKGFALVMASPDAKSVSLWRVRNGADVAILGSSDRWYRVQLLGLTGYMHHSWVWIEQYECGPFDNKRHIQVRSFQTLEESEDYIRSFSNYPLVAYLLTNGWFAVTLKELFDVSTANGLIQPLKEHKLIPADSFVTYGNTYVRKVCCD